MSEKILLISDLAGYGKVALSAMIPILSHMEFDLYNLPTALVSNTLNYGKFDILDTTNYMQNTIRVWEELGFEFDSIFVGFILSNKQVDLIMDIKSKLKKNIKIFADPIMGDDGGLYHGIPKSTIDHMKDLCSIADYVVPNYTEAALLTGSSYKEEGMIYEEACILIDKIRDLGSKSVIVTSMCIDGQAAVVGYDFDGSSYFMLPFEYIPVSFPGTGDIFSSFMMGNILLGKPLKESVQIAMDKVKKLILFNKDNEDKFRGIPVEVWLHKI